MDETLSDQVRAALVSGVRNLAERQSEDGSWHFAYAGPTFLLPMYVSLRYISGLPIPEAQAERMRVQLRSAVGADDGIGMYRGGPSWVFTSSLGYVALRLLGEPADAEHMVTLRHWIRRHGGPLYSASWGKSVLSTLGLYEYRGLHPLTPETWLLPSWAPMHPRRFGCYTRQTYLPMAWLYGRRATIRADDLVVALRSELYPQPYEDIDWASHRSTAAPSDNYRRLTWQFRALSIVLRGWERVVPGRLRAHALRRVEAHIVYEDDVTEGVRIGVVNAVLNTLVHHFRDPEGPRFWAGLAGVEGCLAEQGAALDLRPNNSTQQWDTSLVIQALASVDEAVDQVDVRDQLRQALGFVRDQQFVEELPEHTRFFRDRSQGGWPLSTRAYGWVVSDCTAEALNAAFGGERLDVRGLAHERLADAVELILHLQNRDGGWGTCERTRAGRWLERLNPSQVFADIMVGVSHVECTASCMRALAAVRRRSPSLARAEDIDHALRAGRDFLLKSQRADGSFEGFWGICFTYGTWFGISGLRAAGVPVSDPSIRHACDFLLSIQRADGAWGESPQSCVQRRHVPAEEGKVVMTAWAVLALVGAGRAHHPACERGVRFLLDRQHPDGGYSKEGSLGVFHHTGPLDYDGYRHYFPVWALADWYNASRPDSDRRAHDVRSSSRFGSSAGPHTLGAPESAS